MITKIEMLLQEIGAYGVQCSETKELAPSQSLVNAVAAVKEALRQSQQEAQPVLEKYQPCGCVLCTCENTEQCQGCGAKNCGTHPIGKFPNPLFTSPAQPQVRELTDEEIDLLWLSHSIDGGNGKDFARAVIAADRAIRQEQATELREENEMSAKIETLIAEFQAYKTDVTGYANEYELGLFIRVLAALRHADQQSQPQTGMVLAPVEPTGEMLVAGGLEVRKPFELGNTFASRIYKSMIAVIHETN